MHNELFLKRQYFLKFTSALAKLSKKRRNTMKCKELLILTTLLSTHTTPAWPMDEQLDVSRSQRSAKTILEDDQKILSGILTPQVLQAYENQGFAKIGKVIDERQIVILRNRLEQIMLGEADVPYEDMIMQLDSPTGLYEDAGAQTFGWKGSTLQYRKILFIEKDKVFADFIFQKRFTNICQFFHPNEKPFTHYRTMVMNKPANGGTDLPWHQDKWPIKEREPSFTIYIALDAATRENGCVQAFPGSHKSGLLGDTKGFLTEERITELFGETVPTPWELEAGEAIIMNRLCVHSSGRNSTLVPRKAISILF